MQNDSEMAKTTTKSPSDDGSVNLVIPADNIAALVRYVVNREQARHAKMNSEGARHAAIVTLNEIANMDPCEAAEFVDIALSGADPIVDAIDRRANAQFAKDSRLFHAVLGDGREDGVDFAQFADQGHPHCRPFVIIARRTIKHPDLGAPYGRAGSRNEASKRYQDGDAIAGTAASG